MDFPTIGIDGAQSNPSGLTQQQPLHNGWQGLLPAVTRPVPIHTDKGSEPSRTMHPLASCQHSSGTHNSVSDISLFCQHLKQNSSTIIYSLRLPNSWCHHSLGLEDLTTWSCLCFFSLSFCSVSLARLSRAFVANIACICLPIFRMCGDEAVSEVLV